MSIRPPAKGSVAGSVRFDRLPSRPVAEPGEDRMGILIVTVDDMKLVKPETNQKSVHGRTARPLFASPIRSDVCLVMRGQAAAIKAMQEQ